MTPALTGIVVHWHDEDGLARLAAAWPADPRFELLVIDNGSRDLPALPQARLLASGRNLGFAGAVNRGLAHSASPLLLLLNPDARPLPGALESLLEGFEAWPDAAGLVPKLVDAAGVGQHRWQLRPLPTVLHLLLQAFFVPVPRGLASEPPAGRPVEQPAAAALALRRRALDGVGGFDPAFHPAWFEDVDLARRLAVQGSRLRYWPPAVFEHAGGTSLASLGYERFLWIYSRNLCRYTGKHHGAPGAGAVRCAVALGALLRTLLVPARRPRRASDRAAAVRGLLAVAAGAVTGWRRPRRLAALTRPELSR